MLISIIIPVYNVEDYILDCLNSIDKQKGEFEVIIVNDGSKDNSVEIVEKFIKYRSNFRLVSKENGGLSSARNFGLKFAKGKYISFIDSDDLISNSYIEQVTEAVTLNDVDMLILGYVKSNSTEDLLLRLNDKNKDTSTERLTSYLCRYEYFSWMRIVKKEFMTDLNFPEGYLYEDMYFTTILNSRVKNIFEIKNPIYGYRKRKNSITTSSIMSQFRLIDTLRLLKKNHYIKNKEYEEVRNTFVESSKSLLINWLRVTAHKDRLLAGKKINDFFEEIEFMDVISTKSSLLGKSISLLLKMRIINSYSISFLSLLFKVVDRNKV